MLPKKQRLTRIEIEEIKKGGQTLVSPSFRLRYTKNNETFKVAPVVSKKVSSNAVNRNSIRREIYNVVESLEKDLIGLNIIIFLQKKLEIKDISKELTETLKSIKK